MLSIVAVSVARFFAIVFVAEFVAAGECHQKAGDQESAAECFESFHWGFLLKCVRILVGEEVQQSSTAPGFTSFFDFAVVAAGA